MLEAGEGSRVASLTADKVRLLPWGLRAIGVQMLSRISVAEEGKEMGTITALRSSVPASGNVSVQDRSTDSGT